MVQVFSENREFSDFIQAFVSDGCIFKQLAFSLQAQIVDSFKGGVRDTLIEKDFFRDCSGEVILNAVFGTCVNGAFNVGIYPFAVGGKDVAVAACKEQAEDKCKGQDPRSGFVGGA
jgi:hypothetical protein